MIIIHTKTLPNIGTTHNPEIKKKTIIDKGTIPKLMTFSTAIFKPGQTVETHQHDTMYEVFYITSGKAEFIINNQKIQARKNDCITIEPGEKHSQTNPYKTKTTWLYFGIATD